MRRSSNLLVALGAAAVCAFMTYLTLGAGLVTILYNVGFLAVMLIIIFLSWLFGFRRMRQTVNGLDGASRKLVAVYKNQADMADITRAGSQIFEVEYLDRKYQEYLGYLRKTNSPTDIGDYIGEYEINNYTHRRLVEMVPDILTSLGILGTFMGLVWGLRGFNPVSYEAMASSITSLIDGIKIAFVTSIYGISLSMAYLYMLRGALTSMSESLDNFLDKYYLCAVSPTDATAMNHVLANQKEQTRVLEDLSGRISEEVAASMEEHIDPVTRRMNQTLEHFTDVVTLNQQELLENIAAQVMAAMKKEFFSEFMEMRTILRESNSAQKEYLNLLNQAQSQFEVNVRESSRNVSLAAADAGEQHKAAVSELQKQQQNLREFVDYMTEAVSGMTRMNEQNERILADMERLVNQSALSAARSNEAMAKAVEAAKTAAAPPAYMQETDLEELTQRMDRMIALMEKQQKQQGRRGLFNR